MPLTITPDTLPRLLREIERRLANLENTSPLAAGSATAGTARWKDASAVDQVIVGLQAGGAYGVVVGASGVPLTQIAVYAPSLTPTSVGANSTSAQTFTVSGLATADKVVVNGPALTVGVTPVHARVSAANTLEITFANVTAGSLTPAAGSYLVVAIRS